MNTLLVKKRPVMENENYDLLAYLEDLEDVIPVEIGEVSRMGFASIIAL